MDIANTIYIIDHCTYNVSDFFLKTLPGCEVEDGSVVKFEGKEYSIMPKEPVGIDVQRDLKFYMLELWIRPKEEMEEHKGLSFFTACPDCNSSFIYDIGHNVWECHDCQNTWSQKSRSF